MSMKTSVHKETNNKSGIWSTVPIQIQTMYKKNAVEISAEENFE
jgi:hypothetical protein